MLQRWLDGDGCEKRGDHTTKCLGVARGNETGGRGENPERESGKSVAGEQAEKDEEGAEVGWMVGRPKWPLRGKVQKTRVFLHVLGRPKWLKAPCAPGSRRSRRARAEI